MSVTQEFLDKNSSRIGQPVLIDNENGEWTPSSVALVVTSFTYVMLDSKDTNYVTIVQADPFTRKTESISGFPLSALSDELKAKFAEMRQAKIAEMQNVAAD